MTEAIFCMADHNSFLSRFEYFLASLLLVVRDDIGCVILGGTKGHFSTHILKLKARNI